MGPVPKHLAVLTWGPTPIKEAREAALTVGPSAVPQVWLWLAPTLSPTLTLIVPFHPKDGAFPLASRPTPPLPSLRHVFSFCPRTMETNPWTEDKGLPVKSPTTSRKLSREDTLLTEPSPQNPHSWYHRPTQQIDTPTEKKPQRSPRSHSQSNQTRMRTQMQGPCSSITPTVPLHPTLNLKGSWKYWQRSRSQCSSVKYPLLSGRGKASGPPNTTPKP